MADSTCERCLNDDGSFFALNIVQCDDGSHEMWCEDCCGRATRKDGVKYFEIPMDEQ
jgi:hypothetical protein